MRNQLSALPVFSSICSQSPSAEGSPPCWAADRGWAVAGSERAGASAAAARIVSVRKKRVIIDPRYFFGPQALCISPGPAVSSTQSVVISRKRRKVSTPLAGPVFYPQAGHAHKFPGIRGHQDQLASQCLPSNKDVIGADRSSAFPQCRADDASCPTIFGIERELGHGAQENRQFSFIGSSTGAPSDSVLQLEYGHGGNPHGIPLRERLRDTTADLRGMFV